MVITAVCVVCIPAGETRTIKQLGVFLVTAFFSILAYIWLLLIVQFISPDIVELWEAAVTVVFLIILIILAFLADKYEWLAPSSKALTRLGGQLTKAEAAAALKAESVGKDATPEAIKAKLEAMFEPIKSKAYYRRQAMKAVGSQTTAKTTKVMPEEEEITAEQKKRMEEGMRTRAAIEESNATSHGVIRWERSVVDVMESGGAVTLIVERVGGHNGEVSVEYTTKNQRATAGKDYEAVSGKLTWADGDAKAQKIEIKIFDDDEFEKDEDFTVILSEVTGGAKFDENTDGSDESDICTVMIVNDDVAGAKLMSAIKLLSLDSDAMSVARGDWAEQLKDCLMPDGTGPKAWAMHILTFPWKFLFALVPPAAMCGGWPCFVGALFGIGFQVILINDFASQLGCEVYIKKSTTAITLVALGTSLPDTFASMQAAKGDKYADNSIGNVTGSNSVNVFFGLGIPWLIAAIYWAAAGATPAFVARFGPGGADPLPYNTWLTVKDKGAFVVKAGDLGFSVIVFTIFAILTIAVILIRRRFGGQELGGNKTWAYITGIGLTFFWFLYVTLATMYSYGFVGPMPF